MGDKNKIQKQKSAADKKNAGKAKANRAPVYVKINIVQHQFREEKKQETISQFSRAVDLFEANEKDDAYDIFSEIADHNPEDRVVEYYMHWCKVDRAPHQFTRKEDV